jgi:hypothetical protein
MGELKVNIEISQALRKLKNTTPGCKRALVRAVNGGLLTARAEAARQVKATGFLYKVGTIKNYIKLVRATESADQVIGSLRSKGYPIALIKFDVQPAPIRRGAGFARPAVGIFATIGGKEYGNSKAFYARINRGKGEHVGVFIRTGSTRLPIKQLFGPSMPDALSSPDVYVPARAYFDKRFDVVLAQQIKYEFGS